MQQHCMKRTLAEFVLTDVARDDEDACHDMAELQTLLNLIQAKTIVDSHFGKDTTIICSAIRQLRTVIPHTVVLAMLKYLGFGTTWLEFFGEILQMSIAPYGPSCGVPVGMACSNFLYEVVQFCLKFAVIQGGTGASLYYLTDEIWIFGDPAKCDGAWTVLQNFTSLTGLKLDKGATGSVTFLAHIDRPCPLASLLPPSGVFWGLLKHNPLMVRRRPALARLGEFGAQLRNVTLIEEILEVLTGAWIRVSAFSTGSSIGMASWTT